MPLNPASPNSPAGQSNPASSFAHSSSRTSLPLSPSSTRSANSQKQAGHHPDIDIRYNRVRLALVTHSAGGLTEKDFDLAAQAQSLAP